MTTALPTRKSLQGLVIETTEGTPADVSSGSDILSLQDGFTVNFDTDSQENAELNASVDKKASIIGLEHPKTSHSHYFRHSGVEGTRPLYDKLLRASFGSTVDAPVVQKQTGSGSTSGDINTRAILKLAGGGGEYERGDAILLKDSTNTYSIHNVLSVSGNDLTLLFNMRGSAPASGISCGKNILYKTADEPPSLTHWIFRGNGASKEVFAGMKVASMELSAVVGEPLNISYSMEGTSYGFDPIRVESTDQYLDFNLGAGALAAVVNTKLYSNPHELADALQEAMGNTGASGTFIVDYKDYGNASGKFFIAHSAGVLNLLHNTGANTANAIGDKIGYSLASDDTGASGYFSDSVQDWSSPYSQTLDSNANPLILKNAEVMLGTFERTICTEVSEFTLTIDNTLQPVPDACAESGVGSILLQERNTSLNMTMTMRKHDAKYFEQFRVGDTIQFQFNGGIKVGGNWVAGKCVNVAIIEAKIIEFQPVDADGRAAFTLGIEATANSTGLGVTYANLL